MGRTFWGLSLVALCAVPMSHALPPTSLAAIAAANGAKNIEIPSRQIFLELLKAYKGYPEYFKLISNGAQTFDDIDPDVVLSLPDKVLQSRVNQFNKDFLNFRKLEKIRGDQFKTKSELLKATPVTDTRNRGELEVVTRALEGHYQQIRKIIFLLSVQANSSVMEALQTLPPEKRISKALQNKAKEHPKMPGTYGGSRTEWLSKSEVEKINLTPVDDAFYKTQLGQKLEKDLGGKADYWSYDYGTDELYVVVNDSIGKLRVKQDTPGIRYVQTRVGSEFADPVGSDTKVDMLTASGRFLTGEPESSQPTLFGKAPSTTPIYQTDQPATGTPATPTTPTAPASGGDHHNN